MYRYAPWTEFVLENLELYGRGARGMKVDSARNVVYFQFGGYVFRVTNNGLDTITYPLPNINGCYAFDIDRTNQILYAWIGYPTYEVIAVNLQDSNQVTKISDANIEYVFGLAVLPKPMPECPPPKTAVSTSGRCAATVSASSIIRHAPREKFGVMTPPSCFSFAVSTACARRSAAMPVVPKTGWIPRSSARSR